MALFLRSHRFALLGGVGFFLAFLGLTQTRTGLRVTFHPPFTFSPPGELNFWLGFILLLVPGSILIGYGLSPWAAPRIEKVWGRLRSLNRKQLIVCLILLFILAAASARLSHLLILRDCPITDDENGTRFGGRVLALGRVTVPQPEPFSAYSTLFLFQKEGTVTSVDWPGPVAVWAAAEWTRTGPLIFALSAAAAAVGVALICGLLFSPGYGLAAFILFLFSPMAFLLSATTHAHLLSREAIALTILFFILAKRRSSGPLWAVTGFLAACAFCCRPVETTALLSPLLADFAFRTLSSKPRDRRPLGFFFLGAVLPLALFALYNHLVTGNFALPPRFFMEGPGDMIAGESLLNRFGANTGYNLFMLSIWFLGPLGAAAVIFGTGKSKLTRLLGIGVGLNLLAGLLHDNHGIHIVGPIHYSECAVPLTVIALAGLMTIKDKLAKAGLAAPVFAAAISGLLVFGMGTFIAWQSGALNHQARIQSDIYGLIDRELEARGATTAVVIAPRFADVWRSIPEFRDRGSWVFEWRRPRPDLSDKVLIVQPIPDAASIFRTKFPGRPIYRLTILPRPPYLVLAPAEE
jgi:hypothetical protein